MSRIDVIWITRSFIASIRLIRGRWRSGLVFIIGFVLLLQLRASADFVESPDREAVRTALSDALLYLENSQQKETIGESFFEGEWASYMDTLKDVILVGKKGKVAYDSNSFTVSSIHNALATTYFRMPEFTMIPPMLDRAMDRILTYREGDSFNFWPLISPPPHLKVKDVLWVRGPNHYSSPNKLAAGFCNIVNDSDDTSNALLALKNYMQIRPQFAQKVRLPKQIGPLFSAYRDQDRPLSHPYNSFHGMRKTGAFLTWLAPETPLKPFGFLPSLKHPGIPLGINDVDCVVNANVLGALANYDELETPGASEACRLINRSFEEKNQRKCGNYYPSPYNLHYAAAKALDEGAGCLEDSIQLMVSELLANQREDGSWESHLPEDQVHSSLYALNALLYLQDQLSDELELPLKIQFAIDRGILYVLEQKIPYEEGGAYWSGGVFFSAGTLVRDKLVWRSDPYTTALAVDALSHWWVHSSQQPVE